MIFVCLKKVTEVIKTQITEYCFSVIGELLLQKKQGTYSSKEINSFIEIEIQKLHITENHRILFFKNTRIFTSKEESYYNFFNGINSIFQIYFNIYFKMLYFRQ